MRDQGKSKERVSNIGSYLAAIMIALTFFTAALATAPRQSLLSNSEGIDSYAIFVPPHPEWGRDDDQNGRFEYLSLGVRINSTTSRDASLVGCMFYSKSPENYGDLGDTTTVYFKGPCVEKEGTLNIGMNNWTIYFHRFDIYNWNRSGSWTIRLTLFDMVSGSKLDVDYHYTSSYSPSDFDLPPASLEDSYSDYTVDEDMDGKADKLVVNVTLYVNIAGNFTVAGFLYNHSQNRMLSNDTIPPTYYPEGSHYLTLSFDVTSYQDYLGPFLVLTRVLDEGPEYFDEDDYWTTTTSFG